MPHARAYRGPALPSRLRFFNVYSRRNGIAYMPAIA